MSLMNPRKKEGARYGSRCCGAATPPAKAQCANEPSDTRPTSIKSTASVEEPCSPGCCESAEQDIVKSAEVVSKNKAEGCSSGCGDGSVIAVTLRMKRASNISMMAAVAAWSPGKPREVQKSKGEMRQGIYGLKDRLNFQNVKTHVTPLPSHPSSWRRIVAMASRSLAAMVWPSPWFCWNPTNHPAEDYVERLVIRECSTECIERGVRSTCLFIFYGAGALTS